ncbi:MAG: hypothetical protein J4F34_06885 [Gemmatimonadetes bacterium]|nr:hypothetical protein [Gemmatimonadota bacterium]
MNRQKLDGGASDQMANRGTGDGAAEVPQGARCLLRVKVGDWEAMHRVNATGPLLVTQALNEGGGES